MRQDNSARQRQRPHPLTLSCSIAILNHTLLIHRVLWMSLESKHAETPLLFSFSLLWKYTHAHTYIYKPHVVMLPKAMAAHTHTYIYLMPNTYPHVMRGLNRHIGLRMKTICLMLDWYIYIYIYTHTQRHYFFFFEKLYII